MSLLLLLAPTAEQQQIPRLWYQTGARVAVEVAFRSSPFDETLLWEDITPYVRRITTNAGRSEELDSFPPGSATVEISYADRAFDPQYPDSPWYGYLVPNRPIRIRAQYAGVDYPIFQGFVDDWPEDYGIGEAHVAIPCSDAFAMLANIQIDAPFILEVLYDMASDSPPTAWYKLNEPSGSTTAIDQYGNDGTYNGTPSLGQTGLVTASSDTAVLFSASNEGVSIPGPVITTVPFAVEFMYEGAAPNNYFFFYTSPAGSSSSFVSIYHQADYPAGYGAIALQVKTGNSAAQFSGGFATSSILDGAPHHVVVGVDDASVPFCYVDGTQVAMSTAYATPSLGTSFVNTMTQATIANTRSYNTALNATLGHFLIWDGVRPSAARIAARASAALNGWIGNTTAEQLTLVLDAIGWPALLRSIGTGATIVGTEGFTGSVNDYIAALTVTEGGQCYIDGESRLVFRGRTELANDTRTATSQAAFGDA